MHTMPAAWVLRRFDLDQQSRILLSAHGFDLPCGGTCAIWERVAMVRRFLLKILAMLGETAVREIYRDQ